MSQIDSSTNTNPQTNANNQAILIKQDPVKLSVQEEEFNIQLSQGSSSSSSTADVSQSTNAEQIKLNFQTQFTQLAQDAEKFHQVLANTLGADYDKDAAEQIRLKALEGDFSWLPETEVLTASQFADTELATGKGPINILGAYDGTSILINNKILSNSEQAGRVYAEEAGHVLDKLLNFGKDAKGDEGALFSLFLHNNNPTAIQITQIKNEDDFGWIANRYVEMSADAGNDPYLLPTQADVDNTNLRILLDMGATLNQGKVVLSSIKATEFIDKILNNPTTSPSSKLNSMGLILSRNEDLINKNLSAGNISQEQANILLDSLSEYTPDVVKEVSKILGPSLLGQLRSSLIKTGDRKLIEISNYVGVAQGATGILAGYDNGGLRGITQGLEGVRLLANSLGVLSPDQAEIFNTVVKGVEFTQLIDEYLLDSSISKVVSSFFEDNQDEIDSLVNSGASTTSIISSFTDWFEKAPDNPLRATSDVISYTNMIVGILGALGVVDADSKFVKLTNTSLSIATLAVGLAKNIQVVSLVSQADKVNGVINLAVEANKELLTLVNSTPNLKALVSAKNTINSGAINSVSGAAMVSIIGAAISFSSQYVEGRAGQIVNIAGSIVSLVGAILVIAAATASTGIGIIVGAVVAVVAALVGIIMGVYGVISGAQNNFNNVNTAIDSDGDGKFDDDLRFNDQGKPLSTGAVAALGGPLAATIHMIGDGGKSDENTHRYVIKGAYEDNVIGQTIDYNLQGNTLNYTRQLTGKINHAPSATFNDRPLHGRYARNDDKNHGRYEGNIQLSDSQVTAFKEHFSSDGLISAEHWGDFTEINTFGEFAPPPQQNGEPASAVLDQVQNRRLNGKREGRTFFQDINGDGNLDEVVLFQRPDTKSINDIRPLSDASTLVYYYDDSHNIIAAEAFNRGREYGKNTVAGRILDAITSGDEDALNRAVIGDEGDESRFAALTTARLEGTAQTVTVAGKPRYVWDPQNILGAEAILADNVNSTIARNMGEYEKLPTVKGFELDSGKQNKHNFWSPYTSKLVDQHITYEVLSDSQVKVTRKPVGAMLFDAKQSKLDIKHTETLRFKNESERSQFITQFGNQGEIIGRKGFKGDRVEFNSFNAYFKPPAVEAVKVFAESVNMPKTRYVDINEDGIPDMLVNFNDDEATVSDDSNPVGLLDSSRLVFILDDQGNAVKAYATNRFGAYDTNTTSSRVLKDISASGDTTSLYAGLTNIRLSGSVQTIVEDGQATYQTQNKADESEPLSGFTRVDNDAKPDKIVLNDNGSFNVSLSNGLLLTKSEVQVSFDEQNNVVSALADFEGDGVQERAYYNSSSDTWSVNLSSRPDRILRSRTADNLSVLAHSLQKGEPGQPYGVFKQDIINSDGVEELITINTDGSVSVAVEGDNPTVLQGNTLVDALLNSEVTTLTYLNWVARSDQRIMEMGTDVYKAFVAFQQKSAVRQNASLSDELKSELEAELDLGDLSFIQSEVFKPYQESSEGNVKQALLSYIDDRKTQILTEGGELSNIKPLAPIGRIKTLGGSLGINGVNSLRSDRGRILDHDGLMDSLNEVFKEVTQNDLIGTLSLAEIDTVLNYQYEGDNANLFEDDDKFIRRGRVVKGFKYALDSVKTGEIPNSNQIEDIGYALEVLKRSDVLGVTNEFGWANSIQASLIQEWNNSSATELLTAARLKGNDLINRDMKLRKMYLEDTIRPSGVEFISKAGRLKEHIQVKSQLRLNRDNHVIEDTPLKQYFGRVGSTPFRPDYSNLNLEQEDTYLITQDNIKNRLQDLLGGGVNVLGNINPEYRVDGNKFNEGISLALDLLSGSQLDDSDFETIGYALAVVSKLQFGLTEFDDSRWGEYADNLIAVLGSHLTEAEQNTVTTARSSVADDFDGNINNLSANVNRSDVPAIETLDDETLRRMNVQSLDDVIERLTDLKGIGDLSDHLLPGYSIDGARYLAGLDTALIHQQARLAASKGENFDAQKGGLNQSELAEVAYFFAVLSSVDFKGESDLFHQQWRETFVPGLFTAYVATGENKTIITQLYDQEIKNIGPKLDEEIQSRMNVQSLDDVIERLTDLKGIGDLSDHLLPGYSIDSARYLAGLDTALIHQQARLAASKGENFDAQEGGLNKGELAEVAYVFAVLSSVAINGESDLFHQQWRETFVPGLFNSYVTTDENKAILFDTLIADELQNIGPKLDEEIQSRMNVQTLDDVIERLTDLKGIGLSDNLLPDFSIDDARYQAALDTVLTHQQTRLAASKGETFDAEEGSLNQSELAEVAYFFAVLSRVDIKGESDLFNQQWRETFVPSLFNAYVTTDENKTILLNILTDQEPQKIRPKVTTLPEDFEKILMFFKQDELVNKINVVDRNGQIVSIDNEKVKKGITTALSFVDKPLTLDEQQIDDISYALGVYALSELPLSDSSDAQINSANLIDFLQGNLQSINSDGERLSKAINRVIDQFSPYKILNFQHLDYKLDLFSQLALATGGVLDNAELFEDVKFQQSFVAMRNIVKGDVLNDFDFKTVAYALAGLLKAEFNAQSQIDNEKMADLVNQISSILIDKGKQVYGPDFQDRLLSAITDAQSLFVNNANAPSSGNNVNQTDGTNNNTDVTPPVATDVNENIAQYTVTSHDDVITRLQSLKDIGELSNHLLPGFSIDAIKYNEGLSIALANQEALRDQQAGKAVNIDIVNLSVEEIEKIAYFMGVLEITEFDSKLGIDNKLWRETFATTLFEYFNATDSNKNILRVTLSNALQEFENDRAVVNARDVAA